METLNKVIKIFSAYAKCEPEMYEGPAQSTIADALFYLKEYQYIIEQCASVLAQKYPSQNDVITWNELTQMTGKPVWLESYDDITKFNIDKNKIKYNVEIRKENEEFKLVYDWNNQNCKIDKLNSDTNYEIRICSVYDNIKCIWSEIDGKSERKNE